MSDILTEFRMWRKVYQTLTAMYALGYMDANEYIARLSDMGFLPHEISAELHNVTVKRDAIEQSKLASDLEKSLAENQS